MATLRTVLELALRGGTETQRQLEQVGKVGAEAFKKIDEGSKKVPASLRAVDAAASSVKGNIESLAASTGTLGATLSAIGGPVGVAALGVVGLGTAFTALTKKAFDAAGSLVDASDATGIGIEQLQKYHIAAATAGVSAGEFDQAVQGLAKSVGQAQAGTGRLSKLLGTLDSDLLQNLKSATSTGEQFDLMAKKLANTESASQKVAIATAAGGDAFVKLLPLLKDGQNGFDEIGKSAEQAGAIMSDKAVRAADDAGDKFTELALILESQVNAAFIESAPLIDNIAEAALKAIPSVLAFVNSFLPSTSIEARLADVRKAIFKAQDELVASEGWGPPGTARQQGSFIDRLLGTDHSEEVKARLDALIAKEHELEAEATKQDADAKKRTEARLAQIKEEIAAAQKGVEARAAQRKAEQDAAKAARDAEAASKKATEEHKRGLEAVVELEQKAQTAGLEGIAKIEAERDVAYEKFAELVKKDGLNQEEAARGYLAIWQAADKEITQTREQEEQKRADAAQKASEKEAAAAKKAAEKAQEELQKPFDNAIENIQRDFGDMFTNIFENGLDGAGDFADQLKHIFARLAGELAELMVIQPVLGSLINGGQSGASIFPKGSENLASSNSFTLGIGRLTSGIGSLIRSVFSLDQSTQLATQATQQSTNVFEGLSENDFGFSGIGDNGAPFSGIAQPGQSEFPSTGTPGVIADGSGSSAALSSSAIGGYIALITTFALAITGGLDALRRSRKSSFSQEGLVADAAKGGAKATGGISTLLGGDATFRGWFGSNPAISDRIVADIFLGGGVTELLRVAGVQIIKPPTKGTALRKRFEEFIEDPDNKVDFFSGNRFRRGIGQEGTRDILREKFGTDKNTPDGSFVRSMREYIHEQQISIGLTDKQLQQFTGLGVAFRGALGHAAGNEEQRSLAIIADTLGSLQAGGIKAAQAMAIVGEAITALGSPSEVFQSLNEFFTSGNNDIAVDDYKNAVQGLAQVFFKDVPLGVRAADLALDEFNKDGVVTFEELATRVHDVSAAAELLVPVFQDLTNAIADDPSSFFENGIVSDRAITDFHDAVLNAMKDATISGFVQGMLQAVLEPTVLEPFTRTSRETIAKVTSGEITPEAGLAILKQAGIDAAASLKDLDPFLRQFIVNVASLTDTFDGLTSSGQHAADALDNVDTPEKAATRAAFFQGIDRQTLGILDPGLAARFDQEVQARQRLFDARSFGVQEGSPEWLRIERLNELERNAIVEQAAEERTRIEEQAAEQIQRIIEQNTEEAKRALAGVSDYVKQLTGTTASPLPPEVALANAQNEFNTLAAAARGGDLSAIEKLPEAGQNLLALAQSLFGSTDQFFALFGPTLDTLKEIAGLDPSAVALSPDAKAQIDAINADKTDTLAKLDKHHAEAMALWQAMLDALHIGPTGKGDETTGTTSGDQKSVPIVGGTAGQYGLNEVESRKLQTVLAGAKQGGDIQQDIQAMIAAGSFAGGKYGPLLAQLFEGATSAHGQLAVLHALDEKITTPSKFQPVLGFANEGMFKLHGPDSIPLIPGRVNIAPGEHATVSRGDLTGPLLDIRNQTARGSAEIVAELRALRRDYAGVLAELTAMRAAQRQRHDRERAMAR